MNIYWDYANEIFISSLTNNAQVSLRNARLRDKLLVRLYVLSQDPTTGAFTNGAAPSGYAPKFGLRRTRTSDDLLIFNGTWTYDETNKYYQGTVNLGESSLTALFSTDNYLDFVFEFTMQDVSGDQTYSTQGDIRIWFDILRGGETETTWVPPFPWVEEFTNEAGQKCLRFKNSNGETLQTMSPMGS